MENAEEYDESKLRGEIGERIEKIVNYRLKKQKQFTPGLTRIRYAGAVYDSTEIKAMVNTILDGWFGMGMKGQHFENELAKYVGTYFGIVTNSGSSANLLAVTALMNKDYDNRLNEGDEVITTSCSFPTTVNPLIQNRLTPVFIDCELGTYNIQADKIEGAISEKTRAIFVAHTLGNPNNLDILTDIAKRHNLLLLEDNCDALGSTYRGKKTGSFGLMSTYSFYPAHHITMGEGGAILTNNSKLQTILKSIRDWGRACYCSSDEKHPLGACRNRFSWQLGKLPHGYDHKYTYTNIGYNLKPVESQVAMGLEQIKRIPDFTAARKKNFKIYYDELEKLDNTFILPRGTEHSEPSWFGFPLTIIDNRKIKRKELIEFLENNFIETRLLFSGNILRHPAYENISCRIVGSLENSDKVLNDTFFLGTFPGMSEEKIKYITSMVKKFVAGV